MFYYIYADFVTMTKYLRLLICEAERFVLALGLEKFWFVIRWIHSF